VLRKINVPALESRRAHSNHRKRSLMSMLDLRHYTIRFRESRRLRYRLPRKLWRFLIRV